MTKGEKGEAKEKGWRSTYCIFGSDSRAIRCDAATHGMRMRRGRRRSAGQRSTCLDYSTHAAGYESITTSIFLFSIFHIVYHTTSRFISFLFQVFLYISFIFLSLLLFSFIVSFLSLLSSPSSLPFFSPRSVLPFSFFLFIKDTNVKQRLVVPHPEVLLSTILIIQVCTEVKERKGEERRGEERRGEERRGEERRGEERRR